MSPPVNQRVVRIPDPGLALSEISERTKEFVGVAFTRYEGYLYIYFKEYSYQFATEVVEKIHATIS